MKLKSHSGLKKRIKKSGTGKFFFKKPGKNHLLTNKSKRQKRFAPLGMQANERDENQLKKLLPY